VFVAVPVRVIVGVLVAVPVAVTVSVANHIPLPAAIVWMSGSIVDPIGITTGVFEGVNVIDGVYV